MARTLAGALALAALPSALAFRNTSPFFLFSTADLPGTGLAAELASFSSVSDQVIASLKGCPSRTYIVARQDGVSSTDYSDGRAAAPQLSRYLGGKSQHVASSMVVSEVVGPIESTSIATYLKTQCGAHVSQFDINEHDSEPPARPNDGSPQVIQVTFPAPPTRGRTAALSKFDADLEYLISHYASSNDYTVIYMTSPRTQDPAEAGESTSRSYEMEDPFGDAMHMELKRDTAFHKRAAAAQGEGALFERYQYLSPGLFMGLSAIVPLFFILYVGISAITSLDVSYFAFSKEMGPAGQKKQ